MVKKTISILIPTFNEEENVGPIYEAVKSEMINNLSDYNYEILFIDNKSEDSTRKIIEKICDTDKNVRAIFNAKNFGQFNSPYYGLINTTGDCAIPLCADFQDPVSTIPRLVHKWEEGYKIVCAVKTKSKENPIMRLCRTVYYKMMHKLSSVHMIEHFTGFGLYDRSFLEVLRKLDDSTPFYRGLVPELGYDIAIIEYTQERRRAGKSSNNFRTLYDAAMLSITSYTKFMLRLPVFLGAIITFASIVIAVVYLIFKAIKGDPVEIGFLYCLVSFFGGIILFFQGIIGEYIIGINERFKHRPLVVEEKRINF